MCIQEQGNEGQGEGEANVRAVLERKERERVVEVKRERRRSRECRIVGTLGLKQCVEWKRKELRVGGRGKRKKGKAAHRTMSRPRDRLIGDYRGDTVLSFLVALEFVHIFTLYVTPHSAKNSATLHREKTH